jgi:hypothetical protein
VFAGRDQMLNRRRHEASLYRHCYRKRERACPRKRKMRRSLNNRRAFCPGRSAFARPRR